MILIPTHARSIKIVALIFLCIQFFAIPKKAFAELREFDIVLVNSDSKRDESISTELKNLNDQLTILNQILESRLNSKNLLGL